MTDGQDHVLSQADALTKKWVTTFSWISHFSRLKKSKLIIGENMVSFRLALSRVILLYIITSIQLMTMIMDSKGGRVSTKIIMYYMNFLNN